MDYTFLMGQVNFMSKTVKTSLIRPGRQGDLLHTNVSKLNNISHKSAVIYFTRNTVKPKLFRVVYNSIHFDVSL